jgi:hypothetical protein
MQNRILDVSKVLGSQNLQYTESLLMSDIVPAGQSKPGKISISNLGHFYCYRITGSFETLQLDNGGATVVDTGISFLRGQLIDGSKQRALFNDYIPLDLFLSPGRVKSSSVSILGSGEPGNSLFYPIELNYLFTINSDIIMNMKNDSDVDLKYNIMFHGLRILQK